MQSRPGRPAESSLKGIHGPVSLLCLVFGSAPFFFPRERTPCGHGAQVIIEGREKQSDGGEKDKDNPTNKKQQPTTAQRRVSTIL